MARPRTRVYTPPPDAGAYRPPPGEEHEGGGRQWLVMSIMAIVLAASGFVLWSFYGGGKGEGAAPVIEAQDGGFKQRYDGPAVDDVPTEEIDRALAGQGAGAPAAADQAPKQAPTRAPTQAPTQAAVGRAGAQSPIAPRAAAAATPTPRGAGAGGFVVQIAALRAEGAADVAWERLSRRDPALFAGASKDIQRADLGGKGVYYRLRAGYFADRAEAGRFCDRVKSLGQECIVVVR